MNKFKKDLPKSQQTLIHTLCVIISGIMIKETVNLNKIKNQIGTITDKPQTKANSHYRRLTRFFNNPFCRYVLWKWILHLVIKEVIGQLDKRKLSPYLLLDGTCWEFGKTSFHFLTLSIVYEKISLPIFFINLAKKGISNQAERKRFLQMANKLYPLQGMILLADREYVGRDWFRELIQGLGLNFIIRLSQSDYKADLQEQGISYASMCKRARKGKIIDQSFTLGDHDLRMVITKHGQSDELIILLTNLNYKKSRILSLYRIRWQIECLFKCLKTNGFNLEDLSFKDPAKVRLLISIVIACYVLSVREGLAACKLNPYKLTSKKRYESVFRKGYSLLCIHSQKVVLLLQWLFLNVGITTKPKPT
ncbi:transposase [Xanthocytophaga flava]|uniref:transposase n=1 Tax=Xanthocytophaga flava TaxID=3048013 RepID=UPI0028D3F120|nr:transposase [Xanthocytophaga flavus]